MEAKGYFTQALEVAPDAVEAKLLRANINLEFGEYNVVI